MTRSITPAPLQPWIEALCGGSPWAPREPAAARLAQWLAWTDSIQLAAVMDRSGAAIGPRGSRGPRGPRGTGPGETARAAPARSAAGRLQPSFSEHRTRLLALTRSGVQATLAEWATAAPATPAAPAAGPTKRPAQDATPLDPVAVRRAVSRAQRQLEDAVAARRAALRARLSEAGPQGAELAAIDGVLEAALAERQRHGLASAGPRLAVAVQNLGPEAALATIMAALTAELDLRLHPLRGLEQALQPTEFPSS